jgi:para-aminobenzoate synthetase component 1
VSELFGTYAFKNVNQLISTVEAELREGVTNWEIIAASFPMGSMTGAPKVSAMELAERFEKVAREVYSGSVGYITPEGDFDFNVVIRSIAINRKKGLATLHVGGAITILSDAEQEYEECLLKAESVLKAAK